MASMTFRVLLRNDSEGDVYPAQSHPKETLSM